MTASEGSDLDVYFGRNRARLAAAYASARAGGWPFCWPGLLFPQAWFLYRKMYVWAALVTVGPLVLANWPGAVYLDWFASVLGAFGLKLYFADAERKLARLRGGCAEEEARARIARAGGVSVVGAAIGVVYIFAVFTMTLKPGAGPVPPLR